MKKIIYLFYYLARLDYKQFNKFTNYVISNTSLKRSYIFFDIIKSVFKYNISIQDYFHFRFYELDHNSRRTYAGTGFMYEYQLKKNPIKDRIILESKIEFVKKYKRYISRKVHSLEELKQNTNLANELISLSTGKIVVKLSTGQIGAKIKVLNTSGLTSEKLINYMSANQYDLVEEFISQHKVLQELSPSGVNTLRIITNLNKFNKAEILAARLRISINSSVDNLAAGNIATPINLETGIVSGNGVYSDITKKDEKLHPISKITLVGIQIPFWKEAIKLAQEAAEAFPQNRSIGWDIAITDHGPELIEGNHNWCKILWQMPVKQGLKHQLEMYD